MVVLLSTVSVCGVSDVSSTPGDCCVSDNISDVSVYLVSLVFLVTSSGVSSISGVFCVSHAHSVI